MNFLEIGGVYITPSSQKFAPCLASGKLNQYTCPTKISYKFFET